MFVASTWWQAGLLAVSLGLAMAGMGFAVTHDANHGAYSAHKRLNRMMCFTLDLIGASSYVWRTRHNVVHHTYTNIAGADSDIDSMPLARFAPDQPLRLLHRFQHFYVWLLYGLLAINWHTIGDLAFLLKGRVAETSLRWPRGWSSPSCCSARRSSCPGRSPSPCCSTRSGRSRSSSGWRRSCSPSPWR